MSTAVMHPSPAHPHLGVSYRLQDGLPHLVGRTIRGIVVVVTDSGRVQWHIAFTDGTMYELYAPCEISATRRLYAATLEEAIGWAERDNLPYCVIA